MGIAPAGDVDAYLQGITHDEITGWDCDVDDITPVEYTRREGTTVPVALDDEQF